LGVSWGESNLDANGAADLLGDVTDSMWTLGAYHPLTKHLNLVAEYSESKHETNVAAVSAEGKAKTIALGAILFF
jgi:hypothetical protein